MPASDLRSNALLSALPQHMWTRWETLLEPFPLRLGQVLYDTGVTPSHVYFPVSALIAILQVLADGACTEVTMVGREGAVGVLALLGHPHSGQRAVVQRAGMAVRIDAAVVQAEFEHSAPVRRLLLRYIQDVIAQTAQTAACNRHHTPEQQLCRYLLLSLDRLGGDEVMGTHEFIATSLGLRRETITDSVGKLQGKGAIRSGRGRILVLDRSAAERCACECYAVDRQEYDSLLAQLAAWRGRDAPATGPG